MLSGDYFRASTMFVKLSDKTAELVDRLTTTEISKTLLQHENLFLSLLSLLGDYIEHLIQRVVVIFVLYIIQKNWQKFFNLLGEYDVIALRKFAAVN